MVTGGGGIAPGQRVRVRESCGLCPGRYGIVDKLLPGANRKKTKARGGRWFVNLQRLSRKSCKPRIELFWGDELEVVN